MPPETLAEVKGGDEVWIFASRYGVFKGILIGALLCLLVWLLIGFVMRSCNGYF